MKLKKKLNLLLAILGVLAGCANSSCGMKYNHQPNKVLQDSFVGVGSLVLAKLILNKVTYRFLNTNTRFKYSPILSNEEIAGYCKLSYKKMSNVFDRLKDKKEALRTLYRKIIETKNFAAQKQLLGKGLFGSQCLPSASIFLCELFEEGFKKSHDKTLLKPMALCYFLATWYPLVVDDVQDGFKMRINNKTLTELNTIAGNTFIDPYETFIKQIVKELEKIHKC